MTCSSTGVMIWSLVPHTYLARHRPTYQSLAFRRYMLVLQVDLKFVGEPG